VKKAGRDRVKQRVMSPIECLARLSMMVPPPRYPLFRLHGVLAPRHPWRARVVRRPPESYAGCTTSSSKIMSPNYVTEARPEHPQPLNVRGSNAHEIFAIGLLSRFRPTTCDEPHEKCHRENDARRVHGGRTRAGSRVMRPRRAKFRA